MRFLNTTIIRLAKTLVVLVPLQIQATPAFPEAAGFGKETTGGRSESSRIIAVTRLDDYWPSEEPIPGTLRYALEASGPRIVIFKTGGVVSLKQKIDVSTPHLTILGQTAPGDGIAIRNHCLRFITDQVIVRGIRIRPGDIVNVGQPPRADLNDAIQLSSKTYQAKNIIVDHCSFGWSKDEMAEIYFGGKDVTFSNCSFTEALWHTDNIDSGDQTHGYGPLIDGKWHRADSITFYRCLMAHNQRRNPWIKSGATVELINNVVYNWDTEAMGIWRGSGAAEPNFVNIINNYFKPGPQTNQRQRGITIKPNYVGSKIHLHGNIGPGRPNHDSDEWAVAAVHPGGETSRADNLVADAFSGISEIESAEDALDTILAQVGAWPRDIHDARVVANVQAGNGTFINSVLDIPGSKVEAYPAYESEMYPPDADGDGLPDKWETEYGLDPQDPSDALLFDANGYHHIETYANSLINDTLPNNPQ